jgi:hypothetical protein
MSKIRLFKCSVIYRDALIQFYGEDPKRSDLPYDQQYRALMDQAFYWADFWKLHLEATGRYVVEEVVSNAAPLQEKWIAERAKELSRRGDRAIEIVLAQLQEFQPDVFFAHMFPTSRPDLMERVRREVPSIRLVIGWDGINICDAAEFPGRDIMLTCAEFMAKAYRQQGVASYCLPFAFETSLLNRLRAPRSASHPSFVGSVHYGSQGHNARAKTLMLLARETDIELYLSTLKGSPLLAQTRAILRYASRGQLGHRLNILRLERRNLGARHGLRMYQTLRDSPFTLNSHIDAAGGSAANVRLFEATGAGTCLLTDWKENLRDYFEPDEEVVTYRSPEECLEKYRWLQNHPLECAEIARRGQARTLRDHTYPKRIDLVTEIIDKHLSKI